MHFDLRDLEIFVAVAEAGSIAAGAESCHTVASAISKRLAGLEAGFDTPLFDRGSKGVKLTAAGMALLPHARSLLGQAGQLDTELRRHAAGLSGRIRLHANLSAIVEFLPEALAEFHSAHPDIEVQLEEHVSGRIIQNVAGNLADIGIVSEQPAGVGLDFTPFRRDRLVLVVPVPHALATRTEIGFADTLNEEFIGLHADSALQRRLLRAAADAGRELKLSVRVSGFDAVCAMVTVGLGIGVIPATAAEPYRASRRVAAVPLDDDWAWRELLLCVRNEGPLPIAAQRLFDHLAAPA